MIARLITRVGALALALCAAPLAAQQDPAKPAPDVRRLQGRLLEMQELQGKLQGQWQEQQLQALELQGKLLAGQFLGDGLQHVKLLDAQLGAQLELEHLQEKLLGMQLLNGDVLEGKFFDGEFIDDDIVDGKHLGGQLGDDMRAFKPRVGDALVPSSPSWYHDDPADSAYRAAYQLFSRQEYRAAADRFSDLRTKYPTTRYLCDASYFEGFARYRLGTPTDLRNARKVLDAMAAKCSGASRLKDVPELLARVDGALARLGDADATERVRRAASEGTRVCDREERNVKIQALSALAQMDGDGARPILERVLAQKDECSAPVRREALQLVARQSDAQTVTLLGRTARNDPDPDTRMAAVEALGRVGTDPAFAAIEELMRTSTDEQVQVAAVRAMARSESPKAQATVRAIAERQDVAERLRASVIAYMASKGGTPTDYWRTLYGKMESDDLKRAVVNAVDRTTPDGVQFLVSVASDPAQPSAVRSLAVSRVRQNAPIADLYKLFEASDTRSVRQAIVSSLAARKEPEATDRLIDIAKRGTDPEVRAAAIRYLGEPARRDDPRVRKALADILGGPS